MSNLFGHCRAGVSTAQPKTTNKREQCRIYLNIAEREDLDAVEDTRFPR